MIVWVYGRTEGSGVGTRRSEEGGSTVSVTVRITKLDSETTEVSKDGLFVVRGLVCVLSSSQVWIG